MSMFALAISCLTTSNLPWFMDLTFQVPMQYCSLQHQTFLLSLVTSTAGYCFSFGFIPSSFLELFLCWSSVAYWAPTDLGSFSFNILSFCLSYCSWGSQGKNTKVVCHPLLHILPELSTMTHPSWVALQSMAHTFIESDVAVVHVIRSISFLCNFHPVCPLIRIGDLWKLPYGRDCLYGKLPLVLMGWVMISKSLIQFSVD